MRIRTAKEALLRPLQAVSGVVEKRQTLPILANILINVVNSRMTITATDLELEIRTTFDIDAETDVSFTLPARKLMDICRALPAEAALTLDLEANKALLRSGNSRFSLSILDAKDYPSIEATDIQVELTLPVQVLKRLIEKTQFAMAQQDVRYYLNGMLFELDSSGIRTVATDGHRLATARHDMEIELPEALQIILPRKGVIELARLLNVDQEEVKLEISSNHLRVSQGDTLFISKLIDGRFPDYKKVIPRSVRNKAIVDKGSLKEALLRTAILSNEKYRGVRFSLSPNRLDLLAHNPEQEEAEEFLEIDYDGEELMVGFNVNYLVDTLNAIDSEQVEIGLNDANSSSLVHDTESDHTAYVIMPMRL